MRQLAAAIAMEGTPVGELSLGGQIAAVVFPLLVAALGGAIVTDFKGLATWHRRQAGPGPSAPADRTTTVIQKIVGWWFLIAGLVLSLGVLVSVLSG
ncbi:hypothetical protein [Streptomyces sp. TLI_146]|uniref:hypothetical protein n=1 Tax=Streptomyces sp. TLI_146 TaxID=1938858 RepID=UPI000C704633|nr:hypothetical protein [Streptomyces sp. TLI_146]PKV77048.1 hypothetical protein BX283_7974 [Streptomyces sp. TLI_146]